MVNCRRCGWFEATRDEGRGELTFLSGGRLRTRSPSTIRPPPLPSSFSSLGSNAEDQFRMQKRHLDGYSQESGKLAEWTGARAGLKPACLVQDPIEVVRRRDERDGREL